MGRIGGGELLLILLIALLVFGPGKLADLGKGLGEGLRSFKKGIADDVKPPPPEVPPAEKPAAPAAPATPAAPAAPTDTPKS